MSKIVNATNVEHALNVRAAIVRAVYARWPSDASNYIQRNAIVADCVSIYNAQMQAHAAKREAHTSLDAFI